MTDKERDELLINMANDMNKMKNDMKNVKNDMKERDIILQKLSDDMKERDKLLINMANDMKNVKNDMNNVKNDMNNVKNDMNNMKNEMKEIKEEQRNLSRTVAKIEVEHGEKLQILLDVVTGQDEKNKKFEKRFEEDEKILDRHSDQIYYLQLKANKRKPIL